MAKKETVFFCKECGFESPKWAGQCPACKAIASFTEEPVSRVKSETKGVARNYGLKGKGATSLKDVSMDENERVSSGLSELDRVLGSGIVPGSLVLLGGDPGIGKSTILLQVVRYLSEAGKKVLYISGEESLQQIKMRANRLGQFRGDVRMASETDLSEIEALISSEKPDFVVIDSIQTMYRNDIQSAPGSVSQVRESTNILMQIAKRDTITIFIVGHVTKEGMVAGPRVLEHMVDTVLYFEGDRSQSYRMIRAVKNRFGGTDEVGVFEMTEKGLLEVENPSDYLLAGRPEEASGSALSCIMEGTRPILMEVQALVSRTAFGLPRRTMVGLDYNRMNLLIAVLEKRANVSLSEFDVYISLTGGLRTSDPGLDLSVILALASGYYDLPLSEKMISFGEVGLLGEIRGTRDINARVKEAVKLGYSECVIPATSFRYVEEKLKGYCIPCKTVRDAVGLLNRKK